MKIKELIKTLIICIVIPYAFPYLFMLMVVVVTIPLALILNGNLIGLSISEIIIGFNTWRDIIFRMGIAMSILYFIYKIFNIKI